MIGITLRCGHKLGEGFERKPFLWYIVGMDRDATFFGLLRYRRTPCPTWRGFIVALILLTGCVFVLPPLLYDFLSPSAPVGKGMLVVEGWIPDYASEEAMKRFQSGQYDLIVTTGVPIETGYLLSEYGTTAEVGAATLRKLGAAPDKVHSAPAHGSIPRDRTLASALALSQWMADSSIRYRSFDIVTLGPHARRTRMLFQRVVGDSVVVGIIGVPESQYGANTWWQSSAGVKDVLGELLGYLYVSAGFTRVPTAR
jgi:hypothetical protein